MSEFTPETFGFSLKKDSDKYEYWDLDFPKKFEYILKRDEDNWSLTCNMHRMIKKYEWGVVDEEVLFENREIKTNEEAAVLLNIAHFPPWMIPKRLKVDG